jgi:hypothetical protein
MSRNKEDLMHLLELDYSYSQQAIENFDEFRARLKSWMITAAAGISAVAFSAHSPAVFWAGALMVVFFASSEMYYIDIQEEVIARSRQLEQLIDSLSRDQMGPQHEEYRFGFGKIFRGGKIPKPRDVMHWLAYRTFNPLLYGGLLSLMILAAIVAPAR